MAKLVYANHLKCDDPSVPRRSLPPSRPPPDAEAITEAAQRPTMHFLLAVRGEAQQAQGMFFHSRDLLVPQRAQTPQRRARIGQQVGVLEDGDSGLPEAVVELGRLLLGRIDGLDAKRPTDSDRKDPGERARECEETARLMAIQ